MMRELYIEISGTKYLIDIDENFNIIRNYKTPYFSNPEDIFQDGTYSVVLPLTEHNAKVFGYLDREDMTTNIPYTSFKAHYYVDGITVLENADVHVLSLNEGIEVQFTYGLNRDKYLPLFNRKLNEIETNASTITTSDWIASWDKATVDDYLDGTPPTTKFQFIDYIGGERVSDATVDDAGNIITKYEPNEPYLSSLNQMTLHPYVSIVNILDLIEADYAVENSPLTIDLSNVNSGNRLDDKGLILSKKSEDEIVTYISIGEYSSATYNVTTTEYFDVRVDANIDAYGFWTGNTTNGEIVIDKYLISTKEEYELSFDVDAEFGISISGVDSSMDMIFQVIKITEADETIEYATTPLSVTDLGTFYVSENDISVVVNKGDILKFRVTATPKIDTNLSNVTVDTFLATTTFYIKNSFFSYSPFNGRFDCLVNMPDMNQIDFIKQVLAHSGGFIGYNTDGDIDIFFLDEFKNNLDTNNVYDWTGRISRSIETEFVFGDYAQSNYIKFNNDKDLSTNRKKVISVNDTNLDSESDFITLAFDSPYGSYNAESECILYEQTVKADTQDDGTINKSFENKYVGDSWNYPFVKNDSGIAKNIYVAGDGYYDLYEQYINKPIVKEVEINLDLYESATIDFTKPVYVGEWGKYCMILEVTAPEDELSVVKLLILNDIS